MAIFPLTLPASSSFSFLAGLEWALTWAEPSTELCGVQSSRTRRQFTRNCCHWSSDLLLFGLAWIFVVAPCVLTGAVSVESCQRRRSTTGRGVVVETGRNSRCQLRAGAASPNSRASRKRTRLLQAGIGRHALGPVAARRSNMPWLSEWKARQSHELELVTHARDLALEFGDGRLVDIGLPSWRAEQL